MEFNLADRRPAGLLEKIFLGLAFFVFFLVFSLLYFFHEVAFAIAMHPRFVAIFAKFAGDIVPVQLKTRINKQARKVRSN
ncbi:MAG: hypothetical protein JWP94_3125 [Mucilaginibacter sp.]|nr:hypothetical protein [Mucilaginibacter sp.]